ncbi:MAG: hypothetical protein N4A44_02565 [Alphaproteobacteria bacterium]|nr:hypothetical protein [Alphaproteobacteria bacterium]
MRSVMDQTTKNTLEIEILKIIFMKGNLIIQSRDKGLINKLKFMTLEEVKKSKFFKNDKESLYFAEKTIENFFKNAILKNKDEKINYQ